MFEMEHLISSPMAEHIQRSGRVDFVFLLSLKAFCEGNGPFWLFQENLVAMDT